MASVNKVILIGNLGRDPEIRYTQSGRAVGTLRIATTFVSSGADGQKNEKTEWHSVVLWGKDAENAEKYLQKGKQVYIEGRLQTREYNDKEGIKRYSTEIVCERMQFLGGAGQGGARSRDEEGAAPAQRQSQGSRAPSGGPASSGPAPGMDEAPADVYTDEDIPF